MIKIIVSQIHKNTVMSDEHIVVSLQNCMRFLPTRLSIVVLRRVEEQFPAFRVTTKELYIILRICMAQSTKCFAGILDSLLFSPVSDFKYDLL